MKSAFLLMSTLYIAPLAWAETPPAATPATPVPNTTSTSTPAATYWESVYKASQAYWSEAQKQASTTTETATAWTQEDLDKWGTWFYKVETLSLDNPTALEARLNALGKERWELVVARETKAGLLLICKRPAVSNIAGVMQALPFASGLLPSLGKGTTPAVK